MIISSFFFFITNMKSTRCKNNTIEDKKYELSSIIKEFRRLIGLYRFRYETKSTKILRKSLRRHEKTVNDKNEDDVEYIKDNIHE